MKLNEVEKIPKKRKNKKAIIIATSTATILTIGGFTGWMFFKDEQNDITKLAQSIVSGQNTRKSLGTLSYNPATVRALQSLLYETGFGYGIGTSGYGCSVSILDEGDKNNVQTKEFVQTENLYMLCNGDETYTYESYENLGLVHTSQGKISDKPKYAKDPGEKPELQKDYETRTEGVKSYAKCKVFYTYEGLVKQKVRDDVPMWEIGGIEKAFEELEKEIESEYKKDCAQWEIDKTAYNKYTAWKEKRNKWVQEMTDKGYFKIRGRNTEYDDYADFWTKVARLSLGLTNTFENNALPETSIDTLINRLYPQVYDENGEKRSEVRNLLNEKVTNINNDIKDLYPDDSPNKPNQGGSGSGVTGNTIGGGTSSGGNTSTGGGTSSGGSTSTGGNTSSGGNTSTGGNTSSGGNTSTGGNTSSGGNTSGGGDITEDPIEDTVAPSIDKASIITPITGIYAKGQEVKIRVDFDKNVYGGDKEEKISNNNAPKLLIRFGDNRRK